MDCIQVLRCRPFRFSARSCKEWSLGRVAVCGDAAHVFPPFGGQGIASGFRDAISLAWRLVLVTRSPAANKGVKYDKLLKGWFWERKQQLNKSLASTIRNGEYVTQSNDFLIFVRDWWLWLVQLVPSWRHSLQLGSRSEGLTKYQWKQGQHMAFVPTMGGGKNCPQVYAAPVADTNGKTKDQVAFTDDIIFAGSKRGIFQILILASTPEKGTVIRQMLERLPKATRGLLIKEEATILLNSTTSPMDSSSCRDMYRLATGAEFAADAMLCAGRPKPIGYDPFILAREIGLDNVVILRPDRFIFAICAREEELQQAFAQLLALCDWGSLS